jgi:hypothetical protein
MTKRERALVKVDMSGSEDTTGGCVEAAVALVVRRVADERAWGGARLKFMGRHTGGVWVGEAAKDAHGGVVWRRAVEEEERRVIGTRSTWTAVEKKGGRVQGFSPIVRWHGGVGKRGAHDVVECPQHTLGAPVLRRGIGARHAEGDAVGGEELASGKVIELLAVVRLQRKQMQVELALDKNGKRANVLQSF